MNFVWYKPIGKYHAQKKGKRFQLLQGLQQKSLHIWVPVSQDGVPAVHASPFLYKSPRTGIPGSAQPAGEKEKRLKAAGGQPAGPLKQGEPEEWLGGPKNNNNGCIVIIVDAPPCRIGAVLRWWLGPLVGCSLVPVGALHPFHPLWGLRRLLPSEILITLAENFCANLYLCVRCIFTFSYASSSALYTGHSVSHWVGIVSN